MGKRSLKATQPGIARAKQAFHRTGWTQEYLASAVGLETRQSVWKFFTGRPIERHLFIDLCFQLGLEWEEIAEPPEAEPLPDLAVTAPTDVEKWLGELRTRLQTSLQQQCGWLQTNLDTAQPVPLEQVYTHQALLTRPNAQRWLEVSDLQNTNANELLAASLSALEAVASHPHLVILGQPGIGKTTLLQFLALRCSQGQFQPHRVPLFIALRERIPPLPKSEPFDLETHIHQQAIGWGLTQNQVETLLHQGRLLVLLDGLDEIQTADREHLCIQIQQLAATYPQLGVIVTTRPGGQDYQFRGFTWMELAALNAEQVTTFVQRWFMTHQGVEAGLARADQFLQQLHYPENAAIRHLVGTPVLLHLACLVFQERGMFPAKRVRLYQYGLEILLSRWDSIRGIRRDGSDCQLSQADKLRLLGQIATLTFEQGKLFFEKRELVPMIADFLADRCPRSVDREALWLEAEAVLRTIAYHHGLLVEQARDIYAFSHLTFQEYLVARRVATTAATQPQVLQQLASHIGNERWQEVIRLSLSLLPQPEPLLTAMQQAIQGAIATDEVLQSCLSWVEHKSRAVLQTTLQHYHPTAVRAFYLALLLNQDLSLAMVLDERFAFDLDPQLALDQALMRILRLGLALESRGGPHPTALPGLEDTLLNLHLALSLGQQFHLEAGLAEGLEALRLALPNPLEAGGSLGSWLQAQEQTWSSRLRQCLLKHRDLGYDWQLSQSQQTQLQQYYRATQFLLESWQDDRAIAPATWPTLTTLLLRPSPLQSLQESIPHPFDPGVSHSATTVRTPFQGEFCDLPSIA